MKIKEIKLKDFKRFTDLTIRNIPEKTKLVVLMGPNGCGKSSLLDAFREWQFYNGFHTTNEVDYFHKKLDDKRFANELVTIKFYGEKRNFSDDEYSKLFYCRTAYRNSPRVEVYQLNKLSSPLEYFPNHFMIENDSTINDNYQRLLSTFLSRAFDNNYDNVTHKQSRDEIIGKIDKTLHHLFPDLRFTEIGSVTNEANFYFSKGITEKYEYKKLSGGEKAVFDLILDIIVKLEYYNDTIFCIDEPETHIHTSLQADLLEEIYNLIPNHSQLWIATHSFGMMKKAQELFNKNPNEVAFLNFDGYDFDDSVVIEPAPCDDIIWNKMIEFALGNYSFIAPKAIIFCEGSTKGNIRKDFDARCYSNIFRSKYPDVKFVSLGSCNDIEKNQDAQRIVESIVPNAKFFKLIDRDDRSNDEVADLEKEGITVLCKRNIENYLLDDEVIEKLCNHYNQSELIGKMLEIKKDSLKASIERGNQEDDLKSARGNICTEIKKLFKLKQCGNSADAILRDEIAKNIITPDMKIYQQLENDIGLNKLEF